MQAVVAMPPPGQYALWHRCLRKQRYSRKAALKEITRRNQRLQKGEKPYVSYLCDNCDRYHVGHNNKSDNLG